MTRHFARFLWKTSNTRVLNLKQVVAQSRKAERTERQNRKTKQTDKTERQNRRTKQKDKTERQNRKTEQKKFRRTGKS